jgi:hypothetical protein
MNITLSPAEFVCTIRVLPLWATRGAASSPARLITAIESFIVPSLPAHTIDLNRGADKC